MSANINILANNLFTALWLLLRKVSIVFRLVIDLSCLLEIDFTNVSQDMCQVCLRRILVHLSRCHYVWRLYHRGPVVLNMVRLELSKRLVGFCVDAHGDIASFGGQSLSWRELIIGDKAHWAVHDVVRPELLLLIGWWYVALVSWHCIGNSVLSCVLCWA